MKTFLLLALFSFFSVLGLAQSVATIDKSWKIVPNENVCMVTEAYFPRPQIPVKVDGKTYYGCCENCKASLANDKKTRTAKDALTAKAVDKATSVIAANDAGYILYFENKSNFEKYLEKISKK